MTKYSNSFLLDEVRCGFYIPSEIKQAWAAELEVLQAVDKVCKENNIQYFADWGTLLGTVRHRGFIPWDDDLDIVMKREDYERFRQVENQLPEGFSIHTFRNEEGFREFHATVVGAPSVCFEKEHLRRFHGFPYLCGLDVFILDYVYEDEKKEEERIHRIKYVIAVADGIEDGTMDAPTIESGLKKIYELTGVNIDRRLTKHEKWILLYELAEKICGEVSPDDAEELTQMIPWGIIGKRFRFPKKNYQKSIRLPFEYTTMPVPLEYDSMLKKRYGEYLKLVKAAGGHEYPFFGAQKANLQKLLDFNISGYEYKNQEIFRKPSDSANGWKVIVSEAITEWINIADEVRRECSDEVRKECSDGAADKDAVLNQLSGLQQLIIDIGNVIEQIKGTECETISLIERLCEAIFRLYTNVEGGKAYSEELSVYSELYTEVVESIRRLLECREVVLITLSGKHWERIAQFYEIENSQENTDVYVLQIPYFYKDYDGTPTEIIYENHEYPQGVNIVDYQSVELQLMHPDRIYFQQPYDDCNGAWGIPTEYFSNNLRNATEELIYVPWLSVDDFDAESRAYDNMKYYVTAPGIVYADKVILDNNHQIEMYTAKLSEWSGIDRDIWNRKFVVRENDSELCDCSNSSADKSKKKRMAYFIGIGQLICGHQEMWNKIVSNFNVFSEHTDKIDITVLVDEEFDDILRHEDSQLFDLYTELMEKHKDIAWKKLNEYDSVSDIAEEFDAFYGDAGCLVPEFITVHKPVMVQNIV